MIAALSLPGGRWYRDPLIVAQPNGHHRHLLQALILTGLVVFGLFVAIETGLLRTAVESDPSYLSFVILLVYLTASFQWLHLSRKLSTERNRLTTLEVAFASQGGVSIDRAEEGGIRVGEEDWAEGYLSVHLANVLTKREMHPGEADSEALLHSLTDEIANRHASGHFVSDALLRLGLLGTVVGFILMLAPVSEVTNFDPSSARALLQQMSGGMAVALYTTLFGLVTSILLKLQYQMLDTAAQDFLNRLRVLTDVQLAKPD